MERNAEQKKPDLKTAARACHCKLRADGQLALIRCEQREPIHLAVALEAERRSWREGCLRTGAMTARTSAKVRISSQRDSEAAG